jgi:hypothetical protein
MPDNATMSGQSNPPNGGEVSSTAPPPREDGGALQSWLKTAQAPPQNMPQTASAATPETISQQPQKVQTVPVPVTSMKRGGILGVMDSMADVLAGKQRPELGKDPDGNVYIKQHTMTRGEQWMKIAGEGIMGAAAGFAAGKGAGNMSKAPLAGIQAQQQMADRQAAQMDKAVLDSANAQMLKMKMAEESWRAARLKVTAGQEDVKFANELEDRLTKAGGRIIGTAAHPGDISEILKTTPDVMNHLVKTGQLQIIDNLNPDGTHNGIKAVLMPSTYGTAMLPAGAVGHYFNPITEKMEEFHYSDPISEAEQHTNDLAERTKQLKILNDAQDLKTKTATEKNVESETTARDKELPGKIAETAASTAEKRATASKAPSEIALTEAKTKQVKAGVINDDGTPNPRFELMAEGVLDGSILPPDLKREAKGMGLDPNQIIGRAMEIAKARGQTFSLPIIEQEHKFAMNPKTQAALDGIDRVIGAPGAPGYIQQMLSLAKAADLGPVGAGNSVVLAVKRAYGDTAAKNLNTSIDETRRSIAGLIGNPLLGGSDTDKKLQQAEDMLGSSPTLENLEGATEVLSQALATSRNSMVQNNRYLRQRYGTLGVGAVAAGGPAAPKTPPPAPAGAAGTALNKTDNKQHYVDAQGKDLGVAE